jgi:hypothetical protein
MLTLDQALIKLAEITAPGKTFTAQQLRALAAQVTLDALPDTSGGRNPSRSQDGAGVLVVACQQGCAGSGEGEMNRFDTEFVINF